MRREVVAAGLERLLLLLGSSRDVLEDEEGLGWESESRGEAEASADMLGVKAGMI